jgi:hypothetical protein
MPTWISEIFMGASVLQGRKECQHNAHIDAPPGATFALTNPGPPVGSVSFGPQSGSNIKGPACGTLGPAGHGNLNKKDSS